MKIYKIMGSDSGVKTDRDNIMGFAFGMTIETRSEFV